MRRKLVVIGVCAVLFATVAPWISAADGDDHEITDQEGDTLFDYVDVVWGSFYENPGEPDYLYVALKIANLDDRIGTVYAVHWFYNGVHYDTSFHNGIMIPPTIFKSWGCGYYERRNSLDTWDDSFNSGSFDVNTGVITWKIIKSCVGNPQPGDALTTPYAFTAQRISKLGLIPLRYLFRSFSDTTEDGLNYIIQY